MLKFITKKVTSALDSVKMMFCKLKFTRYYSHVMNYGNNNFES